MPEHEAFLKTILEEPGEANRLIFSDWLQDHGEEELAQWFRHPHPPGETTLLSGYAENTGDGADIGYGLGDGVGNGSGCGYGDPAGFGFGEGYGDGEGGERGSLFPPAGVALPAPGKAQLVILPNGWVVCGLVAEQIGPFQFRLENSSVLCSQGEPPWEELAAGKGRYQVLFRKWGTVTVGPSFVVVRDWVGELP